MGGQRWAAVLSPPCSILGSHLAGYIGGKNIGGIGEENHASRIRKNKFGGPRSRSSPQVDEVSFSVIFVASQYLIICSSMMIRAFLILIT